MKQIQLKPFSDPNLHKDSTMFLDETVEHLTSWLTINPYKGCSLNCSYCFRANWHPASSPQKIIETEFAVDELTNHYLFIPHETPISINNSSTDPLLGEVKKSTFKAMEILERRRLTNPFIIITKLKLTKDDIAFIESLQFLKPIIFVSLSMIPKHIEPTPIGHRIKNLKLLKESMIPTVLYFRPIVKGWNDSEDIILKVLKLAQRYCDAICVGSLRMSKEIRHELSMVGENVEEYPEDFHSKNFLDDIDRRVIDHYNAMKLSVPLFKHSSCAVSYINKIQNYNHLFLNPGKNCTETCPKEQQKRCVNKF